MNSPWSVISKPVLGSSVIRFCIFHLTFDRSPVGGFTIFLFRVLVDSIYILKWFKRCKTLDYRLNTKRRRKGKPHFTFGCGRGLSHQTCLTLFCLSVRNGRRYCYYMHRFVLIYRFSPRGKRRDQSNALSHPRVSAADMEMAFQTSN